MAIHDKANLEVTLNNQQAKQKLEELQKEMQRLIDLRNQAQRAGDLKSYNLYEKQLKKATREAQRYQKQLYDVSVVLRNINGASLNDLMKAKRALTAQTQNLARNTREYMVASSQLKVVNAEISKINESTRAAASGFKNLANHFNSYFTMFTAFVGAFAGVIMGFRKLRGVIYEFEETLTNVYTLLSESDYYKFGQVLEEGSIGLIRDFGFEIKDVNKALFDTISAGVHAGDSIDFMRQAAILAMGGVTKLSVAVDGMTSIMNAYGLVTSDTEKITAAFFTAQKYGKTTVSELAGAIGSVVPIAAQAGITYQELLSSVAALTTVGLSTDMAMTAMKNAIQALLKPTESAARVMREFGVPVGFSEVRAKGLGYTLQRLNEVIEQNPDAISQAIPNIRALTAVTGLSGRGLEKYSEILRQVNVDFGEGSSLMGAYTKQMETAAVRLDKRKGQIQATIIELKETLLPLFSSVLRYSNLSFRALMAVVKIISEYIGLIRVLAYALGGYVAGVKLLSMWQSISNEQSRVFLVLSRAKLVAVNLQKGATILLAGAWALLTGNISRATASMRLFNTVTRLNPVGLMVSLLTGLVVVLQGMRRKTDDSTKSQREFNQELQRTNELLRDVRSLEERAGIMKSLSRDQLMGLKADLEAQVRLEDDFRAELLLKLKQRLTEDEELHRLHQQRLQEGITQEQRVNLGALIVAREKHLARDLDDHARHHFRRIKQLRGFLRDVEKELSGRPEPVAVVETDTGESREDPVKLALAILEEVNRERTNAIKEQYARELIEAREYQYRMLLNESAYLNQKLALLESFGASTLEVQGQIYDRQIALVEQREKEFAQLREEQAKENEKDFLFFLQRQLDGEQKILDQSVQQSVDHSNAIIADKKRLADQEERLMKKRADIYADLATRIGDSFDELLLKQEVTLESALRNVVMMTLDALEKIMVATQAEIIMTAMAKATWNPLAAARAFGQIILVKAAFTLAKANILKSTNADMEGYSQGGYTPQGPREKPVGVVHAGEYVIPQEGLENPSLAKVVEIVEYARRNQTLSRLNITPLLDRPPGFSAGGYTGEAAGSGMLSPAGEVPLLDAGLGRELMSALERNTRAVERLMEWKPSVAVELVKKELQTLERIERNKGLKK